jgi:hypothetical protein
MRTFRIRRRRSVGLRAAGLCRRRGGVRTAGGSDRQDRPPGPAGDQRPHAICLPCFCPGRRSARASSDQSAPSRSGTESCATSNRYSIGTANFAVSASVSNVYAPNTGIKQQTHRSRISQSAHYQARILQAPPDARHEHLGQPGHHGQIQIVRYMSADIHSRWRAAPGLVPRHGGIESSAQGSLIDLFLVKGKTHNTFEGYIKQLTSTF